MKKLKKLNKSGFTMIEIMAVFIILGIVMAITIPTISYFLKGNSKDYYSKLEKTISSSAQDYFNDYRVNLPKEIGYVKRVDINIIQSQKYITEILGIDKKACSGDVVTQKRANGNYSYTACLKCERKKDGSYAYVSDNTECGYSEDNNGKFTILIDGLGNKDNVRIPQGESYTIPNAKAYVNGQALATIKPMPLSIDTNILTTYKIYYNYRSVIKELKITVYDPKEPVLNNITALVNNTNYTSGTFVNKDVDLKLSATDWTKANIYGSGIDYFEYQVNDGQIQKLKPTTTDNKTYTYDIKLKDSGTYNINVRAVDKEKNKSTKKTFVVKIDKIKPTGTVKLVSTNSNYNTLNAKLNLSATDNVGGSGISKMCVQESNNIDNCNFENYQTSKNITLNGTFDGKNRIVYVWYKDKAGNISNSIASTDTYKIYLECSQVQYPKNFSSCSKVCGGGTQQKIATDKFTGKTCSSKTISQQCNTQSCCSSTTVTGYGTCSKTCGGGVKQVYKKSNYNGQNCSLAEETVPCNTQSCCTSTTITGYGSCSKVCGGGVQQVYRKSTYNNQNCTISTETRACNTQSCCSSTTVTGYGTCSKTCGGGVKQVYKKSNYNGQNCSLAEETVPCNTQSCFPSIKRVGDYLDGVIIPLNNSQKVLVKGGRNHEFEKGWYNDSYVKAQVINLNSNGTITSGPFTILTNGFDACGEKYVTGVRVNDNTIFIAGASRLEKGNSTIKYGRFCGFSVSVNNTSFNMLSKNIITLDTGNYSVDGIVYGKDEFTANIVRVNIHNVPSSTGTDYMHLYNYDIYTGSVVKDPYVTRNPSSYRRYDIEGIAYTSGWNQSGVEGIVGMKDNTTAWVYNYKKGEEGIYIGPTGANNNYQYFINESVYGPKDIYGKAEDSSGESSVITRIGTNKLIVRTAVNNNEVYLHFLKKVNGTWIREHVIQAPGYGDLLTGNDINYAYYNVSSKGLYAINYD